MLRADSLFYGAAEDDLVGIDADVELTAGRGIVEGHRQLDFLSVANLSAFTAPGE